MNEASRSHDSTVGWSATALAAAIVASILSLVNVFIAGGPFGLINDAGNGLIGILSATLAILLIRQAAGWPGVAAVIDAVPPWSWPCARGWPGW